MKRARRFAGATWGAFRNRYLSFMFRVALGSVFLVSGASKLPDRASFVNTCVGYDILPDALARYYCTALPWVEIVIGALLVLGLVSRFASAIGILAALSFIIANSVIIYRGLNLECGCLGVWSGLHNRDALIIDFVLLIMGFQIVVHKGEFLSLGSKIFRKKAVKPVPD